MESDVILCLLQDGHAHSFTRRLIRGVVPNLKVGVSQRLFAADSLGGVKAQHLREQIDRKGVGVREKCGEWNPRLNRQGTDVILGL